MKTVNTESFVAQPDASVMRLQAQEELEWCRAVSAFQCWRDFRFLFFSLKKLFDSNGY